MKFKLAETLNGVIGKIVPKHEAKKRIIESVIVPEHDERTESPEFRKSKDQLKSDGHFQCWVCDSKEQLEVHHYAAEWSLANVVDFDKLKTFCEEWDPYGYGKAMKNIPIATVDDIRNLLVLCENHHIGVNHSNGGTGTSIHTMTFPTFIIQKICKDGMNPIPQEKK